MMCNSEQLDCILCFTFQSKNRIGSQIRLSYFIELRVVQLVAKGSMPDFAGLLARLLLRPF